MHHDRFLGQYIVPTRLEALNGDTTGKIYNACENDLADKVVFDNKITRWKARWALAEQEKPKNLEDTLSCTTEPLYPNITTVLNILLTMPVSTATPERSFSTTRSVKTYMRSTMLTLRLSSLALLHAYRDVPIDSDRVIRDFLARESQEGFPLSDSSQR